MTGEVYNGGRAEKGERADAHGDGGRRRVFSFVAVRETEVAAVAVEDRLEGGAEVGGG